MIEEIKNINSDKKKIKNFGFLIGGVLIVLSIFIMWKGVTHYQIILIIGTVFILSGVIIPKVLKPIYKIWMTLAIILGWIMTRVILTILFYLIITPIGVIARLFGKQFLDLSWKKSTVSFWNKRSESVNEMEKQF